MILLRIWIWVAKLQQMHWPSDGWMDKEFLPSTGKPGKRRRTFNRVRRLGDDPEPSSKTRYGYSVVDKIDSHRMFKGSGRWYHSPLYKLLIPPGLTADETTTELHTLGGSLGLFRPTSHQAWVGRTFLPDHIAFESYSEERFKNFTEYLRLRGQIDDVALLAFLYREAVAQHEFKHAIALWGEFIEALMTMGRNLGLPQYQADLLLILARRRIGKDNWSPLVVSEQTRQESAEHAVWIERMFTLAGHKNLQLRFQQTELQMLINQEKLRHMYEDAFNWTSVSPELQYLLDNFDQFEATARHQFMKSMSSKMEVMYESTRGWTSKRIIKDLPPRPKGIGALIAELKRRAARKKPPED